MKKLCIIILFLTATTNIFADSVFKLNKAKDSILLGTGLLLTGSDFVLDMGLKINRQTFDENQTFNKDDVNSFDRFFMHDYSFTLDRVAGNVFLYPALLAPALLLTQKSQNTKNDLAAYGIMYAETLLIANGIKEISKLAVNRYRPMCYFDTGDSHGYYERTGDFANSFMSGHATMAFAGATFATYVFCRDFPDSPWRFAVAGGAYSLALATAAVRVLSGNHFVTDVLAGAVTGTLAGFLVPWLHTLGSDSSKENIQLAAAPNSFSVRFVF